MEKLAVHIWGMYLDQISPLMIPASNLLQLASSGQRVREGPLLLIDNLHKGRSLENIFWYSIAFDMFSSFHNVYIVNLYILRLNWVSSMKVYSLDQLLMKTKKDPTLSKRRNDERDLLYDIFHWNVLNWKNKLRLIFSMFSRIFSHWFRF